MRKQEREPTPLEAIVAQIKETKPLVDENLEQGHYSTLNARRGRQARAIETMKELKAEYTNLITRSAVFILVAGASKNEFTELAAKGEGVFSADPEDFYKDLLKEIHPSLFTSGPSNIFDVLGRVLENKMIDLNVREYPQPQFKNAYQRTIKGSDDVLQLIKDIINDQVGGEIAGVNAISQIVPKAIASGYAGNNTTVVLNTQDEKLTLRLINALGEISRSVFLVVAGKAKTDFKIKGAIAISKVTEENVAAALQTISSQVNRI